MVTVEDLFSKIPHDKLLAQNIDNAISRKIISKTKESLRILNSKAKVGELGKGDSTEARSAVLLEYVLRRGVQLEDGSISDTVRVPLETLGRNVASSKKEIKNLALQVENVLKETNLNIGTCTHNNQSALGSNHGNGRQQTRVLQKAVLNSHRLFSRNAASRRILKKIGAESTGKLNSTINNTSASSKNRSKRIQNKGCTTDANTNAPQQSSDTSRVDLLQQQQRKQDNESSSSQYIRNLSIKLQSFLHDPNNVENKAKHLLKNIIQFRLHNVSQRRQKDIMTDIQSNLIYYEGVCFYLTVRDLEQGDSVDDEEEIGDNDEDNYLSMDDVIHELRIEYDTFSTIFDSVSSSVRKMGKRKYVDNESQSQHQNAKKKKKSATSSNENQRSTSNKSGGSAIDDIISTTLGIDTASNTDELDDDDNQLHLDKMPTSGKPKYVAEEKFKKWKDEILLKTLGSASTPTEKFEATWDHARRILDNYRNT